MYTDKESEIVFCNCCKKKKSEKGLETLQCMVSDELSDSYCSGDLLLYGVQIAFKDFRSSLEIFGSEWVGFKHFIKFFSCPYFGRILWNTIWVSLLTLCTFPLPVTFKIMLNEKLKKVCQTITYALHFVATVVVCSMTIMFLTREGLLSIILGFFGVEAIDFMAMPEASDPIYAIIDV